MKLSVAALLLGISSVSGFATLPTASQASSTSLSMINENGMKKAAASVMAAAFVMTNVALAPPAIAADNFDFGSTEIVAGRSGGRAGGRSSAPRSAARPSSSSYRPSNTRVIERTTVVSPTPMYSPGVIVAPPVYNPMPGLGRFA